MDGPELGKRKWYIVTPRNAMCDELGNGEGERVRATASAMTGGNSIPNIYTRQFWVTIRDGAPAGQMSKEPA